jgi:N-methylhydantoinase B/oxoprolinase/acetone carboxylase alpha subunit
MSDRVLGDMNAQVSSCRTGERRVTELVDKFGVETYEHAVREILDHGERLARARLLRWRCVFNDGSRYQSTYWKDVDRSHE